MANEKEDGASSQPASQRAAERDVDKELLALFGDVSHYILRSSDHYPRFGKKGKNM